ncbi:MAG: type III polyketide synthase [Opitutaceae bacterium]
MSVTIHHIETLLPPYAYRQEFARDRMMRWLPDRRTQRLIRGIYNRSGIETRYSVLPDFVPGAQPVLFNEDAEGRMVEPTTEPRNRQYAKWSRILGVDVARNAINNAAGFRPKEITHVITVSCTGFCNPGLDLEIIRELELADTVERYQIGFMGCYAAFPALRMARQFCLACPDAVVLIVCLELCSLHLQLREEPDSLLANALFADGAAAAVVSARVPFPGRPSLEIHAFSSALAPDSEGDMTWSIGDRGFDIRLSSYVPDIIAASISGMVDRIMASGRWDRRSVGTWAVHPGGRSIVDKVQQELDLAVGQLEDSRAVLRDFGNMSSATILFVLRRILMRPEMDGERRHPVLAMAFGPGLTLEAAMMERLPGEAVPALSGGRANAETDPS